MGGRGAGKIHDKTAKKFLPPCQRKQNIMTPIPHPTMSKELTPLPHLTLPSPPPRPNPMSGLGMINYYMAGACGRYNARSDWVSARVLFCRNALRPIANYAKTKQDNFLLTPPFDQLFLCPPASSSFFFLNNLNITWNAHKLKIKRNSCEKRM